jgi:UDP-GlcNAc:undecaprenyl-phosphate/decaprenyl-phosphate GlcNAc-1-phosphate transferase
MVGAVLRWTHKYRILDVPNERSSHSQPTPRGGGLAIAVLVVLAWAASAIWWNNFQPRLYFGYLCSAVLIAAVSWSDDVWDLSRVVRFAVHSAAAAIVLLTCGWGREAALPFLGEFSLGWLGLPLTFAWIVGLTNAYNFMDGIDGIAAGQAIVAGIGWMLVGGMLADGPYLVLGLAVAASSLGFLFHNWPPAKIFMGDVGSAFLGFTFAFLTVSCSQKGPNGVRLAELSVLFLWPFVFDSILTFFRRLRKRENVFAAHRSHLYQRLVQTGMTHGKVSGLYTALATFGLLPLAAEYAGWRVAAWCLATFPLVLCPALWLFTAYRDARSTTIRKNPSAMEATSDGAS